jgi:hypothetical protein
LGWSFAGLVPSVGDLGYHLCAVLHVLDAMQGYHVGWWFACKINEIYSGSFKVLTPFVIFSARVREHAWNFLQCHRNSIAGKVETSIHNLVKD